MVYFICANLQELVTDLILSLLRFLYPYSVQVLASLQSTIHRAPLLLAADTIIFEDVLGRTSKLQYEYFRHWNVGYNSLFYQ